MGALTMRFTSYLDGDVVNDAAITVDIDDEDSADELLAIVADAFEEHAPGQVAVGGQYTETG